MNHRLLLRSLRPAWQLKKTEGYSQLETSQPFSWNGSGTTHKRNISCNTASLIFSSTQVAGKFPAEFGGCRRRFWKRFSLDAKNANPQTDLALIRASVGPETVPFRNNKGIVHSLEGWVPLTALPQPWRLKDAQGGS